MKKSTILLFILFSTIVILVSACTVGRLSRGQPVENEVNRLIQNAPTAEMYPDAGIINILDESIVEVFKDGRCKETLHVVFKVLSEMGKDNGDILFKKAISHNSSLQLHRLQLTKIL